MVALIISLVVLLIGALLFLDYMFGGPISMYSSWSDEFHEGLAVVVAGLGLVAVIISGLCMVCEHAETKYKERWTQAKNEGWEFFIDGQEVNAYDIDLNMYKTSFDEVQHKVMMTSRHR